MSILIDPDYRYALVAGITWTIYDFCPCEKSIPATMQTDWLLKAQTLSYDVSDWSGPYINVDIN